MAMGVVDTIMVGRVSAAALAAVALGNLYFYTLSTGAAGTLLCSIPWYRRPPGRAMLTASRSTCSVVWCSPCCWSFPTRSCSGPCGLVLTWFHQPPELIELATSYVRVSIVGLVPFLGFVVLRQSLQALHRVRALVAVVVVGQPLNAGLNWVLVYGISGRAHGCAGERVGDRASRWTMMLLLVALGWPVLRDALVPWRRERSGSRRCSGCCDSGCTIGLQQMLEFGVFAAIGLLMGFLGTREMAAHEIALNLASLTFMVPLGVGAAAAVRVGRAVGEGDRRAARERARTALVCGVGFMLCAALAMLDVPASSRPRTPTSRSSRPSPHR